MMWIGSLLLSFILLGTSIAIKIHRRSWLAPSAYFGGIVSISLIFTLFILPNAHYNLYAFAWYLISIIVFWSGDITGNKISQLVIKNNRLTQEYRSATFNTEYFNKITILCTTLGSLSIIVVIYKDGGSLTSLLNIDTLISVARENSLERYEDRSHKEPLLSLILMIFTFLGNLLGGFIFALSNTKKAYRIAFLTFLPNFLAGLILTTRASLLVGLILFLSSFICAKISTDYGRVTFIDKKSIIKLLLNALFLVSSLVVFRTLRSGKLDNFNYEYIGNTLSNIFSLVFGSIPAFSVWFNKITEEGLSGLTLGSISFSGPLSLFGVERNAFPSSYFGGGYPETTIHSIFGALISDFSFFGALWFFFIIGTIAGFLFTLAKNNNLRYGMLLVPVYIYLSGFLINSTLRFNNVNLAIVLFIMLILFRHRRLYK